MRLLRSVAPLAALVLAQVGSADAAGRTFVFERGHLRYEATMPGDAASMNLRTPEEEAEFYAGTGFLVADDDMDVNGFLIGHNVATSLQNCGGLAFARYVGGAYNFPTGSAWEMVKTLGEQVVGTPAIWDVAVWQRAADSAEHFALVTKIEDGAVWVVSKDGTERVYLGPADNFPAEAKTMGQVSYYHLDWDSIDVHRVEDPEPAPPVPAGRVEWGRFVPLPREQKTLIETANAVTKELDLAPYRIDLDGSQWRLRWRTDVKPATPESPGPAPDTIEVPVECELSVGKLASRDLAREAAQVTAASWEKGIPAWEKGAQVLAHPPVERIEGGCILGPYVNNMGVYCQAQWSCGSYLVTMVVHIDHRVFTEEVKTWAMEASARYGRSMRTILAAKMNEQGLSKPERPAPKQGGTTGAPSLRTPEPPAPGGGSQPAGTGGEGDTPGTSDPPGPATGSPAGGTDATRPPPSEADRALAATQVRQGDEALERGNTAEAEAGYRRAVELDPTRDDVWLRLGDLQRDLGRWADAEAAYGKAIKLVPRNPFYHAERAGVLLEVGRREEALRDAQEALRLAEQSGDEEEMRAYPVFEKLGLLK